MKIKCFAACVSSNGEADILPFQVECSEDNFELGEHYDAVTNEATDQGYDVHLLIDEYEPGGQKLVPIFNWDEVKTIQA